MKKLVSMLLIIGIIASLFTCMTVSAATGEPAYLFKAGMDIEYVPINNSTLTQGTFDGKSVLIMECTSQQWTNGGFKFGSEFDTKNRYYVKFKYRIDENATFHSDASKNYIQVAFDAMNWVRVASSYPENAQSEWTTSNVITLDASRVSNDAFDLDFNGVKGKVYVEYIAFFTNESDAASYGEASIPSVTVNGANATIDKNAKTVEYTFAPLTSVEDMQSATYGVSDGFTMGGFANVSDEKYNAITATLTDKSDSTNVYTLTAKSRKYYDVLDIVDFTNLDNASKLEDPDKGSGKWRMTGTTKVGNTNAAYFGSTVTEDRVTRPEDVDENGKSLKNAGTTTLDNWHYVRYDTSKVPLNKKVWVKIAYRFGDNAKGVETNQSKRFYIEYPNQQQFAALGNDNVLSLRNGWVSKTFECTPTNHDFYIGSFGILGKIMIKYVAFFETKADADNYKFGDINATITTDGTTVNAIYDNAEVASNGARVLALYQGDQLKKVVYSADKDEISVTGLDAGTYTAKAFYWNSLDEGYPKFDGAEAAVTVN